MKNKSGQYKLIAEWEKSKAVALVYPGGFSKYSSEPMNTSDDYNKLKINSITDDFNNILNSVIPMKDERVSCDTYIITKDDKIPGIPDSSTVSCFTLPSVTDIWIKDYAPLPARDSSYRPVYIKPLYRPAYLTKKESALQHKAGCGLAEVFKRELIPLPITWDIGNFTHNGKGTGIVTKRILKDNPEYSVKEIKNLFKTVMSIDNLIIINEEPGDITGHVDCTVRFVDHNKIAIAGYPAFMEKECRYIDSIKKTIRKNSGFDIDFIDIPNSILIDNETDGMYSVFGNHVNFLWLGIHLFIPVYGVPSDAAAYKALRENITGVRIIPVRISSLSHFGGALNCMTWKVY